ncbi:DUF6283 family protein [Streptomyces sp. NPDC012825]|uniref:DUF6283 family protein n=1 Tax=Streptomyces sp. NPDC012825 TaxID=3364851 RepID=UPI00369987E7
MNHFCGKDGQSRICGGWTGCHDRDQLLALRVALADSQITVETAEAIRDYTSPMPLFESGAEAAAHGMRDILAPDPEARRTMNKIVRVRPDVTYAPARPTD